MPPKTVTFMNAEYAMCGELGESHKLLDRLAEAKKIGKVSFRGHNYYEVAAVKRVLKEMRTVPPGYVRAVDHAILIGSDSHAATNLCRETKGAPAVKILVGNSKGAWFADKEWLERKLGKATPAPTPKPDDRVLVADLGLGALQAEVARLTKIVEALQPATKVKRAKPEMPKKGIITDTDARKAGYEPIQDITDAFDIPRTTLSSWYTRNQVRSQKIQGRVYLHLDDVHKRAEALPGNRVKYNHILKSKTNGHASRQTDLNITWET
jgi:hypothetical protein